MQLKLLEYRYQHKIIKETQSKEQETKANPINSEIINLEVNLKH